MPSILVRSYANSRAWVPYAKQPTNDRAALRLARQLTREGRDVVIRRDHDGVTVVQQFAAVPLS